MSEMGVTYFALSGNCCMHVMDFIFGEEDTLFFLLFFFVFFLGRVIDGFIQEKISYKDYSIVFFFHFKFQSVYNLSMRVSFFEWASSRENLISLHLNNTCADQPPHVHSLISAFAISLYESKICKLATCKTQYFS